MYSWPSWLWWVRRERERIIRTVDTYRISLSGHFPLKCTSDALLVFIFVTMFDVLKDDFVYEWLINLEILEITLL